MEDVAVKIFDNVVRVSLIVALCSGVFASSHLFCQEAQEKETKTIENGDSFWWSIVKWGGVIGVTVIGMGALGYKMGLFGGNSLQQGGLDSLFPQKPVMLPSQPVPTQSVQQVPLAAITPAPVVSKKGTVKKRLKDIANVLFVLWLGNAVYSSISISPR